MISEREKAIIRYLLENGPTTVAKIGLHMSLSQKTVSQSLKRIDEFLQETAIRLVRKPRVGVFLDGDSAEILKYLDGHEESNLPTSKKDRIQFLCFEILKQKTYFTRQELQDALYISKSTLENDMGQVSEIFRHFNVTIEVLPGKGSFLNLSEQEKRRLAFDLIYYFWGGNWKITQEQQRYLHSIQGIPQFVNDFIDLTKISLVDTLLQEYLKKEQITLNDAAYHSLLLHLIIMIDRVKEKNYLTFEERRHPLMENRAFYRFIASIEETFSLSLPVSEVHYISLHIYGDSLMKKNDSDDLLDETIRKLIHETISLRNESLLLGLVSHIKEAIYRIQKGLVIHNPFLNDVKKNFPLSFEEALRLAHALNWHFSISIPENEVAFLAVHIQVMKEQREEKQPKKVSVLLVCSSGKGTSQLLAARIRRNYEQIDISRILSIQELIQTNIYEDLILSTVDLKIDSIPTIHVSPVLNKDEQRKIEAFLRKVEEKQNGSFSQFAKLIHEDLIFLDHHFEDYQEVITFIGEQLITRGYVNEEMIDSSLKREQLSFTSFGRFATPHGTPEYVKKSAIVFLRLHNEIHWGETKVKYVFFICIKDETVQELEEIYDTMLNVMESDERTFLLKGTKEELKKYLQRGT